MGFAPLNPSYTLLHAATGVHHRPCFLFRRRARLPYLARDALAADRCTLIADEFASPSPRVIDVTLSFEIRDMEIVGVVELTQTSAGAPRTLGTIARIVQ
jgi:hypothetical protein